MIELVVLDIDGVVTDGTVTVDAKGTERKQVNLKDIDAVFELHRRGWKLAYHDRGEYADRGLF